MMTFKSIKTQSKTGAGHEYDVYVVIITCELCGIFYGGYDDDLGNTSYAGFINAARHECPPAKQV